MNWLVKEEPTHYSFDDCLFRWSHGVDRPKSARTETPAIHTQSATIFFYHTGDVKAVVGIA